MAKKRKNIASRSEQRVIERTPMVFTDPKSPISEAYRVIRTNLQFASLDNPVKTMLVTSSMPGEGKSTVIANLAVTLAQAGKHVLIIDADLRKSIQHKIWRLPNMTGLTNVLAENIDYRMIVRKAPIEKVEILVAGPKPPNPAELLGSRRMAEFLKKVSEDYDYVLIDAPPAIPVADAAVLAHSVDGVILVIGYGLATYEASIKTKEQLEKANARILGVIINNVPVDSHSYYYYYYYYYDEKGNKIKRRRRHQSDNGFDYPMLDISPRDIDTIPQAEHPRQWNEQ